MPFGVVSWVGLGISCSQAEGGRGLQVPSASRERPGPEQTAQLRQGHQSQKSFWYALSQIIISLMPEGVQRIVVSMSGCPCVCPLSKYVSYVAYRGEV